MSVAERTVTVMSPVPVRLDVFVRASLPALSQRLARLVIAEGVVRVNGRRAPKGVRVCRGDQVTLPDIGGLAPEPDLPLHVVHEDAALIALDKPGAMPGHALDPRARGTAANFLVARYPETVALGLPLAPGLVHRLDTGTSGLLLAARTAAAYDALRAGFASRRVEKRYLAVVAGAVPRPGLRLALPLAHDPHDRRRMIAAPAGARAWEAETVITPVAFGSTCSLVEAVIRTGVTHQVRVHLALAGYPVLGDALYGGPSAGLPAERHALHAAALSFAHPTDGRAVSLTCPLPDDLRALVP